MNWKSRWNVVRCAIFWGAASTRGDCKWGELSHHMLHIVRNWMTRGFSLMLWVFAGGGGGKRGLANRMTMCFHVPRKKQDKFSEIYLQFSLWWFLSRVSMRSLTQPSIFTYFYQDEEQARDLTLRKAILECKDINESNPLVCWCRCKMFLEVGWVLLRAMSQELQIREGHMFLCPLQLIPAFFSRTVWKMVQCFQFLPLHFIWDVSLLRQIFQAFDQHAKSKKHLQVGLCVL